MFNLDDITNENNKKHNENRPYIPDHPFRILMIGGSGSGKTNVSTKIKTKSHQSDIEKFICMQEI